MSFDRSNLHSNNKKVYDIWYKYSKHEIKEYKSAKKWYVNNKLHRNNYVPEGECECIRLPAIEYSDGDKEWYKNGKLHRDEDKPAIETVHGLLLHGTKQWYKNGELHRDDDKPAIELFDGSEEWYKNGILHREVPPGECGCIRNELPAVIYATGDKEWYKNGVLYKSDYSYNPIINKL
jgi:antitoxin component YwqK of YwqJK toxin-antitoxin module